MADETHWGWWASGDGESYPVGLYSSREAGIAAAVDDGGFEDVDDEDRPVHRIYLVEAQQAPVHLSDWIDVDLMLEQAEESLIDSDRIVYDYDDGPHFDARAEQRGDLAKRIKAACDAWEQAHGLRFVPRTFSASRNEDFVVIPARSEGGAA